MLNLSPSNDQTYYISDPAHSWSLGSNVQTTQVPPCGYSQTVTPDYNPAFVTSTVGATIDYQAFSRDLANVGGFTISVKSTLTGYNFSPARLAPYCSSAFVLQTLDPCELTLI